MKSFKDIAYQILTEQGKPLHYREITDIGVKQGLLKTGGQTPWATMNAQLAMDIINKGESSRFIRTDPGFYGLKNFNISVADTVQTKDILGKARIVRHQINNSLTSKQKGDIGEARIAELITLYGDQGLSCYQPMSDDEGLDLIVKKRGGLDIVYIQVKTTYGYKDRGFVSTVKEKNIFKKERMLIVFAYFDLSEGDLYPNLFCIPAPDFLRLTANENKKTSDRVFTVGLNNPDKSKYAEFMVEKRELANRILEIMGRL